MIICLYLLIMSNAHDKYGGEKTRILNDVPIKYM